MSYGDIYEMDKLMRLPGQFNELYKKERYVQAKHIYEKALRVAEFMELDERTAAVLFGEADAGGFRVQAVQDCYRRCYMDKLMREMPEQFNYFYARREYEKAKYVYDTALVMANFLEVDAETSKLLFGYGLNGGENEEISETEKRTELFEIEKSRRCMYECAVKQNKGQENIMYRRYGEPVRYCPQDMKRPRAL